MVKHPQETKNDFLKTLESRRDHILYRIQKAATNSGRKPKHITLIAVTKNFPAEIWKQAVNVNLTTLGESRIQETQEKIKTFNKRNKIELHFIGHLQSNKTRKAINLFDVLQTVDSINLAKKINKICREQKKKQSLYLQVNAGEDPYKHGITVNNALNIAQQISAMKNISLDGIMTIPPQNISIIRLGRIYKKTREIRDEICNKINKNCKNISMGMSNDFEIAIAEGATHIRIGVGLFGNRPK